VSGDWGKIPPNKECFKIDISTGYLVGLFKSLEAKTNEGYWQNLLAFPLAGTKFRNMNTKNARESTI
jgi:hypothetical protein